MLSHELTAKRVSIHPDDRPVAALLVGATAVGKTEISLQLAERLGAEIVSVDSRLFYRGLDIGTAKPSMQERTKVPHHLIDIADPDEILSLAKFQQLAEEAVAGIIARGRLPMLVGGAGQYVRAVAAGWLPPRVLPDQRLRAALQRIAAERGKAWLHERLQYVDPDAAAVIDARNLRRTLRALEVILTTGRRFSEQRGRQESPCRLISIGLTRPRAELYARIDARIDKMFDQGLMEETRSFLNAGYRPGLPSLSAIGYVQCVKVLRGQLDLDLAKIEIRRATRAFVRRQSNWFKESDPNIVWFQAGAADVVDAIEAFIRRALGDSAIGANAMRGSGL